MTLADVPAVINMEQAAYQAHWPKRNYQHELAQVSCAHYFVMCADSPIRIVGAGGYWLLADEANIMTIAIHPMWQKRGLAARLLSYLIQQAMAQQAEGVTLEVRPSNQAALALYQKFGLVEVGRRLRYYDDGEAALILATPILSSPEYQTLMQRLQNGVQIFRFDHQI
jgi:ribosomal-protein-alanine N-acetyltransferase